MPRRSRAKTRHPPQHSCPPRPVEAPPAKQAAPQDEVDGLTAPTLGYEQHRTAAASRHGGRTRSHLRRNDYGEGEGSGRKAVSLSLWLVCKSPPIASAEAGQDLIADCPATRREFVE